MRTQRENFCDFLKINNKFFRYQSGFQPPGDIPFEDLSKGDGESQQINIPQTNNLTLKGTMGALKNKKRGGIFTIFSSNKVIDLVLVEQN